MNVLNANQLANFETDEFAVLLHAFDTAAVLWDGLPVAVAMSDANGHLLRFNRGATELWGQTPESGSGRGGAFRLYHADGRRVLDSEMPLADALATGRPARDVTLIVERPDGSRVSVLSTANPVRDGDGRTIGAIECFQEVAELRDMMVALTDRQLNLEAALKENDQRLSATYEHVDIGIAEVDAAGRFVRVNEALCAITGFPRAELLSHRLFDHTHPDDAARDRLNYRQQVTGGYDRYSIEKRFIRKNGDEIWVAVMSSSVRDGTGRFRYGVRVVQDVTERKQAEVRNKALLDELDHRVKNTLHTVQALTAHTLREAGVDEPVRRAFDARLAALARTHEQFTRQRWGLADLAAVVRDILAPFHFESHNLWIDGVSVKIQSQAAVTVGLVLHELATNAAKYGSMSVPHGSLCLSWRFADEDHRTLALEWRESGGPEVKLPMRRGFGSKLVEWAILQEMNGELAPRYEPAGFSCRMEIPTASLGA